MDTISAGAVLACYQEVTGKKFSPKDPLLGRRPKCISITLPPSLLQPAPRFRQLRSEPLLVRQHCSVLRGEDLVGKVVESVTGEGFVLLGAENQAYGRVLALTGLVVGGVVQVDMLLPGVGVGEAAELEIDQHYATQAAVVEDLIHPVPLVPNTQALLAPDEAEVAAEFQQEGLPVADERLRGRSND